MTATSTSLVAPARRFADECPPHRTTDAEYAQWVIGVVETFKGEPTPHLRAELESRQAWETEAAYWSRWAQHVLDANLADESRRWHRIRLTFPAYVSGEPSVIEDAIRGEDDQAAIGYARLNWPAATGFEYLGVDENAEAQS